MDNSEYVNRIVSKGFIDKIQTVNPNHLVDATDTEMERTHNLHYIGQRHYITSYAKDENGEAVIDLIDIDSKTNDRGSIFDKSKTTRISENVNAVPEFDADGSPTGKYKHNYITFQPANIDSGLYRGRYEDSPDTAPNHFRKGSDFKNVAKTQSRIDPTRHKTSKPTKLPQATDLGRDGENNEIQEVKHNFETSREVKIDVRGAVGNDPLDVGTSIWDGNNWDNSIKTNVDKQDDRLLDDIEGPGDISKLGSALGNSAANLVNQIGVISDVKKLFTKGEPSERPDGTSRFEDSSLTVLEKAKSEKYKNIKMSSKIGTYNSLENLLGGAAGMFVGSLGKSMVSSMVDDMTSKFTGGVGVAGIVENLGASLESMPSAEEILALNLANYYNMYTAKPGRIVTDRWYKHNFITPNVTDGIDGVKNQSASLRDKVQGVLNKVSGVFNKASDFIAGKSLADGNSIIGKLDKNRQNRETKWKEYLESCQVISPQRKDKEVGVGTQMLPADDSANGRASLGGYSYDVVINWDRQLNYFQYPHKYTDVIYEFVARMRSDLPETPEVDNLLGGLYIEPYYSGGEVKTDFIPFEFNPTINDGGVQAKYQAEELMGRLLSVRSYISTDSSSVTINTKYFATSAPGKDTQGNEDSPFPWLTDWTPEVLREIERKYRKLVYPFISGNVFVRPPIIRIKLGYGREGGASTTMRVSDLFTYPSTDGVLEVTNNIEGATREKRYIATNVVINPLSQDDFSSAYFIEQSGKETGTVSYRRGFSVDLTLMETTKNFLDTVPNYYHYEHPANESLSPGEYLISKNNHITAPKIDPAGLYKIPQLPEFDFFEGKGEPTAEWYNKVFSGEADVMNIKDATDDSFIVAMFKANEQSKGSDVA